jgi:hypothetical protein
MHVILNVTELPHPHTGENLADSLEQCLRDWNITHDKVLLIVSDNGANMIKAVKMLNDRARDAALAAAVSASVQNSAADEVSSGDVDVEAADDSNEDNVDSDDVDEDEYDGDGDEEEDNEMGDVADGVNDEGDEMVEANDETDLMTVVYYRRMKCMAHTLQLVIKKVYVHYDSLIVKVRRFVSRIRRSGPAVEKLHSLTGKVLVTDNVTRWNSTFLMIKRLIEVKPQLSDVLTTVQADNLLVAEWSRLDELSSLLEPFATQTNNLQTDAMSLPYAIPALLDLQCHLQSFPHCKSLTRSLLADIRSRFQFILNPESPDFTAIPAASCLLSPSIANILMAPDMLSLCTAAKDYILSEVCVGYLVTVLLLLLLFILNLTTVTLFMLIFQNLNLLVFNVSKMLLLALLFLLLNLIVLLLFFALCTG